MTITVIELDFLFTYVPTPRMWAIWEQEIFTFLFNYGAGVEPISLILRSLIGLFYQPSRKYDYDCGAVNGTNEWQGKLKYS
jgi:hypothetical protein